MKYEHQINWANAYDVNLDAVSSGLAWNSSIYLLSTVQSLLLERMASLEVCTLYDRTNRTNSYDFLQIERVHIVNTHQFIFGNFVSQLGTVDCTTHQDINNRLVIG